MEDELLVITGAPSCIGRATALAFAKKGADVVVAARRVEPLEATAADCRAVGARALAVPTDATDADAVDELASRAVEESGRIDVWFNNAGVFFFAPFDEARWRTSDGSWTSSCWAPSTAPAPRCASCGRGAPV